MRFPVLLSFICVALRLNLHVSSEIASDGNLFLDSIWDSESGSLFSDDATLLGEDAGDAATEPSSFLGESVSTGFDWAEQTDAVGSGDLCRAAGEVEYTGKIRAREDARSCSSPNPTTNLLQLPGLSDLENSIYGMSRRPKTKPKTNPYPPPLNLPPVPMKEEKPCLPPWPHHLCCIYPEYDKVVTEFDTPVYAVVRECRPST